MCFTEGDIVKSVTTLLQRAQAAIALHRVEGEQHFGRMLPATRLSRVVYVRGACV